MGKYYGSIGYGITEEQEAQPGVWVIRPVERKVYGDIIKNTRRLDKTENLNDDISTSIQISFLADPYARNNFHLIKYATYMGNKWKVLTVVEEYPRLLLTLGGIFNEG